MEKVEISKGDGRFIRTELLDSPSLSTRRLLPNPASNLRITVNDLNWDTFLTIGVTI